MKGTMFFFVAGVTVAAGLYWLSRHNDPTNPGSSAFSWYAY